MNNTAATEPMFSAIAKRYDFCNHLFSCGLDFHWRKEAVKTCCKTSIESALDVCCGSGDMTFALYESGRIKNITACDASEKMLEYARKKWDARKRKIKSSSSKTNIEWLHKPVEDVTLADESFDLITCSFGLRNVSDISQVLAQMNRLLRPGGMLCILEFSLPQKRLIRSLYKFYLSRIMPKIAGLIAGNSEPWHYLSNSIEKWEKIDLSDYLQNAGFHNIDIHPLSVSIVKLTTALKIEKSVASGSRPPAFDRIKYYYR